MGNFDLDAWERIKQMLAAYRRGAEALLESEPSVLALYGWEIENLCGPLAEIARLVDTEIDQAHRANIRGLMWKYRGDVETMIAVYLSKDPPQPESPRDENKRFLARDHFVGSSAQCYMNAYEESPERQATLVISIANALRYNEDDEGAVEWLRRGLNTATEDDRELIVEALAEFREDA